MLGLSSGRPNPGPRKIRLTWPDRLTAMTRIPGAARLPGKSRKTIPTSMTSMTIQTRLTRIVRLNRLTRIARLTRPNRLYNGRAGRFICRRPNWRLKPAGALKWYKWQNGKSVRFFDCLANLRYTAGALKSVKNGKMVKSVGSLTGG